MTRFISILILIFALAACSDGPVNTTQESENGLQVQTSSDVASTASINSVILIDDFTSGPGLFTGGWFGYALQTSLGDVLGETREHGWYNHNGVRVDDVAGTLQWGTVNSLSPQYVINYGTTIGLVRSHSHAPHPTSHQGQGSQLNLNLTPDHEFVIEFVNAGVGGITIDLLSGNGELFAYDGAPSVGEMRIPLSEFTSRWNYQPMSEARAADIDGISLRSFGAVADNSLVFGSFSFAATSSDPASMDECKKGGWADFGFRNQGQCIRFVNTGQDSR